jgi:hypothetical protein
MRPTDHLKAKGVYREVNKTARNERRKLSAGYLNGIALTLFGAGALGPLAAMTKDGATSTLILLVAICVIGSVGLHFAARRLLGGLEE